MSLSLVGGLQTKLRDVHPDGESGPQERAEAPLQERMRVLRQPRMVVVLLKVLEREAAITEGQATKEVRRFLFGDRCYDSLSHKTKTFRFSLITHVRSE